MSLNIRISCLLLLLCSVQLFFGAEISPAQQNALAPTLAKFQTKAITAFPTSEVITIKKLFTRELELDPEKQENAIQLITFLNWFKWLKNNYPSRYQQKIDTTCSPQTFSHQEYQFKRGQEETQAILNRHLSTVPEEKEHS